MKPFIYIRWHINRDPLNSPVYRKPINLKDMEVIKTVQVEQHGNLSDYNIISIKQ